MNESRVLASRTDREYDRCIVCGGEQWTVVREGSDLCRPTNGKIYRLTRCSSCGHVMQNPVPDGQELEAAYSISEGYVPYRPAWKQAGWPVWKILRSWTMARRAARLNRYASGTDLLEVGSGGGDFLIAARRAGWRVRAVEYNSSMAAMLSSELGFDVRAGELVPNLFEGAKFDVIIFWNVLEHLQDPLESLATASDYLRPQGRILLNIPTRQDAESGQWLGQDWWLDLPRHIHFFDRSTLSRVCHRAGLELIVYDTPFVQSSWAYFASCWNYANRAGNRIIRGPLFVGLAAAMTLALPYVAVQAMRNSGTEAFAVAVKK
jgi:SAM-dependent methyltransferase